MSAASVKSRGSKSRRSQSSVGSYGMRHNFVAPKPVEKSNRVVGECKCKPVHGKEAMPAGLTCKVDQDSKEKTYMLCSCQKVTSRPYSDTLYTALQGRGGAFWERRYESVQKNVTEELHKKTVDKDFLETFNKLKGMVAAPGPDPMKLSLKKSPMAKGEMTKLGSEDAKPSLLGLMRQMETRLQEDYEQDNPYCRTQGFPPERTLFPEVKEEAKPAAAPAK